MVYQSAGFWCFVLCVLVLCRTSIFSCHQKLWLVNDCGFSRCEISIRYPAPYDCRCDLICFRPVSGCGLQGFFLGAATVSRFELFSVRSHYFPDRNGLYAGWRLPFGCFNRCLPGNSHGGGSGSDDYRSNS